MLAGKTENVTATICMPKINQNEGNTIISIQNVVDMWKVDGDGSLGYLFYSLICIGLLWNQPRGIGVFNWWLWSFN